MFPPKRLVFFFTKSFTYPHPIPKYTFLYSLQKSGASPFYFPFIVTCTDRPCSRSTRPPLMATPRSQPCRSCPLASSPGRLRTETRTAATTVQIAAAITGSDSGHPEDPRHRGAPQTELPRSPPSFPPLIVCPCSPERRRAGRPETTVGHGWRSCPFAIRPMYKIFNRFFIVSYADHPTTL